MLKIRRREPLIVPEERGARDHMELMELARLNPKVVQVQPSGPMRNGIHIGYTIVLTNVLGPLIDSRQLRENWEQDSMQGAGPILTNGHPALTDRFVVQINLRDGYPAYEPNYYYVNPILCHPNVRPDSGEACLFQYWEEDYTLAHCVRVILSQISYIGITVDRIDRLKSTDGNYHVLNPSALEWLEGYKQQYPQNLPFKDVTAKGERRPPVALIMPSLEAIGAAEDVGKLPHRRHDHE